MGSMFCGWGLLCVAQPAWRAPWLQIPGGAACVLALAIYAVSARHVGRLRGPARYSLDLETSGIYDRVRHPQALALCVLAVGLALLSGSLPYLITLPLWIGFWTAYTYLEEKCELIPAFGEQYLRYREQTPRISPAALSRGPASPLHSPALTRLPGRAHGTRKKWIAAREPVTLCVVIIAVAVLAERLWRPAVVPGVLRWLTRPTSIPPGIGGWTSPSPSRLCACPVTVRARASATTSCSTRSPAAAWAWSTRPARRASTASWP